MFIDWEQNIMFQLRGLALNRMLIFLSEPSVNSLLTGASSGSGVPPYFFLRMACPVCRSVCLRFDSFSCPAYQPPFHHPLPQSPRYALSE